MGSGVPSVWKVIHEAASGEATARSELATTYLPVVRAYLAARWRGTPLSADVDDATQEVFVDLFKEDGALSRLRDDAPGGFRAFLFGVARNAALHVETRHARQRASVDTEATARVESDEESPSHAFDRAWAEAIVAEAGRLHARQAAEAGVDAVRRVELLRARFQDGLPIREIATAWREPAERLHHMYARARREFAAALRAVVAEHHPGTPEEVDARCRQLLGLLR